MAKNHLKDCIRYYHEWGASRSVESVKVKYSDLLSDQVPSAVSRESMSMPDSRSGDPSSLGFSLEQGGSDKENPSSFFGTEPSL